METSRLVLQFVQALAWPVAAVIIVVAFRTVLRQLVARMTRLEALGASAEFDRAVAEAGVERAMTTRGNERTPERVVVARSYADAKAIRDAYRAGPALIDLSALDAADAKRLVDFMAGLVASEPGGTIERVTHTTFRLLREPV